MDIYTLINDNVSAAIGFVGILVGAVLTAIPIAFLQLQRRKWEIEDQNKLWRRSRLLHRLSPVQDWLDRTIRYVHRFDEYMDDDADAPELLQVIKNNLDRHFEEYPEQDSVVFSHIITTGDDELSELHKGLKKLRDQIIESIINKEEKRKIKVSIVMLEAIASKTARRIEYLVEQANPIGGPYHDKKMIFQFFKRKAK